MLDGYWHNENTVEEDISFNDNPSYFVEVATYEVNYFTDQVWDGPCTPYDETRPATLFYFEPTSCTTNYWAMFQTGD